MDLFGNVKVPDMDYLSQEPLFDTAPDYYKWNYIFNNTMSNYTSIFGVPIKGIPETGNCSFDIMSHYWAVHCSSMSQLLYVRWQPKLQSGSTNLTDSKSQSTTFQILVHEANSTKGQVNFRYSSRSSESVDSTNVTFAQCSASPRVVEARVHCHDKSCYVRAIRRLDRDPADVWGEPSPLSAFRNISNWMPGADLGFSQGIISTSELIEHWMVNTDLDTLGPQKFVNFFESLTVKQFSTRLQIAINTYWDATIGSGVRLNSLRPNTAVSSLNRVDMQGTEYKGQVYVCDTALAVLTIVISLVLFAAANISMLLGLLTRTPDILGFVSVSARDNQYFKTHVTSYLSGLETARALRDVPVRVGDVKSEADVGHIALATMDASPQKLSWTRKYD